MMTDAERMQAVRNLHGNMTAAERMESVRRLNVSMTAAQRDAQSREELQAYKPHRKPPVSLKSFQISPLGF